MVPMEHKGRARGLIRRNGPPGSQQRRGVALVATLIVFVSIGGLILAAQQVASSEVSASRKTIEDVRAAGLAQAGVEQTKATLSGSMARMGVVDPLEGVRSLFGDASVGQRVDTLRAQPMLSDGANVGEYSVAMEMLVDNPRDVTVRITSTGYIPAAPENLRPGERLASSDSVSVTVRLSVAPSSVFDYSYFVNNWGWLYGNTITINGNARSNGQMDIGGYRPKITGQPIYDTVEWDGSNATLGSLTSEGGIYSGWDVANADRAQGTGGASPNTYDFEDQIEMPNLTDLSRYEEQARSEGSSITIGGVTVSDGIVGDDPGESQNLYLVGTRSDPIVLNGPVVVRGDVLISGFVTGQGTLYSGGNAYVPDSIDYVDGPTNSRPAQNSRQATESWLERSLDKDFLGVFARENVVVGDFTNSTWQRYVSGWLASPMNSSDEDAGTDLIPHTRAGADGVYGTADDDVLEGDSIFSVEQYTAADAELGLIPPGYSVGDTIPGSGEDIDGDGERDGTLTLTDFEFNDPLVTAFWDGNMPASGIGRYSDIASMYANNLDGTFYTNHAFSWVVFGSQPARLNGAMIARNENIVYGTSKLDFNYDARLLGGGMGLLGDFLPLVAQPMEVLQWLHHDEDPIRNVTP